MSDSLKDKGFIAWLLCFMLIVGTALAGAYQLIYSYRQALESTTERASTTGFLVAEWVNKSFDVAQHVLQETAINFHPDELVFPTQDPERHKEQTALLVERANRTPNIIFLGMLNSDCIVTHTSIGINLGYDAIKTQREYCVLARQKPFDVFKISNMFTSVDGSMNVTISYPLLSDEGELLGFVLAGIDLSFFQQWLDLIEIDTHNVITIYDLNSRILARNPYVAENIGIQVTEQHLNRIANTQSKIPFTHRLISPVDGIDRVWSLRKIGDLPFIVVNGEQMTTAMASWRQMLIMFLMVGTIMSLTIIFGTREYVKNLKKSIEMRELAIADSLTGLWNRRHFTDLATQTIACAQRGDHPLVLIMLDLDHFKNINDTLGHNIGDQVLHEVAQILLKICRQSDVVARWGGEEFIVLLPDTDTGGAVVFSQRLQTQFLDLSQKLKISVTTSQGIASFSANDNLESLIKRADDALYLAKKHGRNRFELG